MKKIYEHYFREPDSKIDIDKFRPITNDGPMWKPEGGLWASPKYSKNSWRRWGKYAGLNSWFKSGKVEFTIHPNAKILNIKTKEDYDKLIKSSVVPSLTIPDWKECLKGYDVLNVEIEELYRELYGWDCDTTYVINPDVMQII